VATPWVGLVVRFLVYALALGTLTTGMLWGAVEYDVAFYDEVGCVEILEILFALGTALLFLMAGRMDQTRKPCSILLVGFLLCIAIRESDYFLDEWISRHAWKALVAFTVLFLITYTVRNWKRVIASVLDFINRPSFGFFVSGLLVLIIFSRLFGYGPFWKELLGAGHFHGVKTIVEEGVEMVGYFLILISSLEYWHDRQRLSVKNER